MPAAVLGFAGVLLAAVLLSSFAQRSVLSTAVLFLAAAVAMGGGLGWLHAEASSPWVADFIELALYTVLFTDGMRVERRRLREAWLLYSRTLLLGMPLNVLALAAFGVWAVGLGWKPALLVAAALAPTDPVFASALIGREEVPRRLRSLLNVESGLNDGLALPLVISMLAVLGPGKVEIFHLVRDVALGLAIGIVVPWGAALLLRFRRLSFFGASTLYEPLAGFAVGLLVLALCELTGANLFLGAFAAGATLAATAPEFRDRFSEFGELLAELFKLAALFAFGLVLSLPQLGALGGRSWLFAALAIFAARPIALSIAMAGTRIAWREWLAAAWFGPKGFASVVFALLILKSRLPDAAALFHLLALVIAASIVLHSSTDVLVARWFHREGESADDEPADPEAPAAKPAGA